MQTDKPRLLALVAAANVDLREKMEEEEFRADLFYRLSVVTVELPPLRKRQGDIPLLVDHFLRQYAERNQRQIRGIAPEAVQTLQAHSWERGLTMTFRKSGPKRQRPVDTVRRLGIFIGMTIDCRLYGRVPAGWSASAGSLADRT